MIPYRVIRSDRRTMALEVSREGEVLVRAPLQMPIRAIESFVSEHVGWIEKALEKQRKRAEGCHEPTADEIKALKKAAAEILPRRVEYFSSLTGLVPTGVKITSARGRFGSCSGKNSICFSCFLMMYPPEAIDYVVLHELAHIRHHDHSKRFWALVAEYMPDYTERRKLLKIPPCID